MADPVVPVSVPHSLGAPLAAAPAPSHTAGPRYVSYQTIRKTYDISRSTLLRYEAQNKVKSIRTQEGHGPRLYCAADIAKLFPADPTDVKTQTGADKKAFYKSLLDQCNGLMQGERNFIVNCANVSSVIYHCLREEYSEYKCNWAGFYITDPLKEDSLYLGPFQGKVACVRIPMAKGVIGMACRTQQVTVVNNVHDCEDHIACDAATEAEIVVPLIVDGHVVGALDIDSPTLNSWEQTDHDGFREIGEAVARCSDWPSTIAMVHANKRAKTE